MDEARALRLIAESPVGRLATVDEHGRPHIVPVVYAVAGDRIHFAVDHKPKQTRRLKRLRNIETSGRASLLVDHYEDEWKRLWWVRVDGPARVVTEPDDVARSVDLLVEKYVQYEHDRPQGPAIILEVGHVTSWAASS